MKRIISLMLITLIMVFSMSIFTFAGSTQTLDQVIGEQSSTSTEAPADEGAGSIQEPSTNAGSSNSTVGQSTYEKNSDFINGLNDAGNLAAADVEGVEGITAGAKTVAAFIVQVLSYVIIAFLAVRVLLDLAFISLPFTRTFLANGYTGQAQADGSGMMQGGMGGMGMGGMGMGGMGMGGYGRGGYGMRGGMGMGGMGMGLNGMAGQQGMMAGQNSMMNRNSSMLGNVQFVSNAALNAVATESALGPDGKTQSPFKIYVKDMTVTLIVTPILILLAATGVVTNFGFLLGGFIVDCIAKLGAML